MFESIISQINVVAMSAFMVVGGLFYLTLPVWVSNLNASVYNIVDSAGFHKSKRASYMVAFIGVVIVMVSVCIMPFALLWAFSNLVTVMMTVIIMLVVDICISYQMHLWYKAKPTNT